MAKEKLAKEENPLLLAIRQETLVMSPTRLHHRQLAPKTPPLILSLELKAKNQLIAMENRQIVVKDLE